MESLAWFNQMVLLGDGLRWLLLGFAVFLVACVTLLFTPTWLERLGFERLRCPRDGRLARVQFRRRRDGRRVDVVRCSLAQPTANVSCGKECLTQT